MKSCAIHGTPGPLPIIKRPVGPLRGIQDHHPVSRHYEKTITVTHCSGPRLQPWDSGIR